MKEVEKLLHYKGELHTEVSGKLHRMVQFGRDKFSDAFAQMAKNEEQYRAYIPTQVKDTERKNAREVSGLPQYTTIEIPYSYAQILAAHTYITTVFLSRDPIFQFSGRHGEGQQAEQCIEALMAYQTLVGQMLVPLYVWLLDPMKYGYGIVGHHWDTEIIRVRQREEIQPQLFGVAIPGLKPTVQDVIKEIPGYSGNRLYNVRPQDWIPDPRVPISQFQRGEFCARYVELANSEFNTGVRSGKYFNNEALQDDAWRGSTDSEGDLSRNPGSSKVSNLPSTNTVDRQSELTKVIKGYEIYVRLSPKSWKLAPESREEIWVFTRRNDGLLIGAQPLGNLHGKFPFDVIEDEVDGYNLFTKSSLEMIKPLNDVMTWLVNTHFYNVRATLNNQFVIDPSMIVMKDLENPSPGLMLRLKPAAYGRDVRMAVSQLQTVDVTGGHMRDLQTVADMVQRATGISDNIMGMVNTGGRKTATEVRSSSTFGVNRLKTKAEYYGAMGFGPLAQKLLQNTQQYYDMDRKFRIVGDLAQYAPNFAQITPESIAGFFDFIPVDGTMPVDRYAQANLWQALMGQMRNFPQIMMNYDVAKIFGWVAGLAGLKNVSQFRVQVVPDATLANSAQAGNSIPLSGKVDLTAVNEPGQIAGMGTTG